ncbi:unnamed protein product, partial [Rotaria socialis]
TEPIISNLENLSLLEEDKTTNGDDDSSVIIANTHAKTPPPPPVLSVPLNQKSANSTIISLPQATPPIPTLSPASSPPP